MDEIVIRALGPGDRDAWAALRHALWPDTAAAELRAELEEMPDATFAGFGAFRGETLVGFAEVSERLHGDGCDTAPVAWLEGIYVFAGWRRQGIGRQLVAAVETWARARGLSEFGSDAELANVGSRLSHALWGFAETGRIVTFRKVL
jgi:aminoglycoside 6'-N-acetyltransferase I